MTSAADVLATLMSRVGDHGQVRHTHRIPGRGAVHEDWPAWANPSLVTAYRGAGVERPWGHQVRGAEAVWNRQHTVLGTSTGSGKSLSYWLPIVTRVVDGKRALDAGKIGGDSRATAIYLAPTKALAADQLQSLLGLLGRAALRDVTADTCDGDTPKEVRDWVRAHTDIVLTNPDFLHYTLLPGHERWVRLLRSLQYVVIDEAHYYRGLLGAHLALILRRLMRLRAHYARPGSPPLTVVVASATIADPSQFMQSLVGMRDAPIAVIDRDEAPVGERLFVLWQPPRLEDVRADAFDSAALLDDDVDDSDLAGALSPEATDARRSVVTEAGIITGQLAHAGARLLTFTRSRRGAETVAAVARDQVGSARVAAYRGGYLPEERRALEKSISRGSLRALATTNALELGIDIAGLDAVVIAGWPGSRASVWQQGGRAGRAGSSGLVILIARQDPLDMYLVDHPPALFDASVEASIIDPANKYVLAPHVCAAAAELPLDDAGLAYLGEGAADLARELADAGFLRQRGSRWFWGRHESASALTDLRGSGAGTVTILDGESGVVIGTQDATGADSALHAGAIYTHQGATFEVTAYDPQDLLAVVSRADVHFHTWSRSVTSTEIIAARMQTAWGNGAVRWGFGDVAVSSQVVEFERKNNADNVSLGRFGLTLPVRRLETCAVWWSVSGDVLEQVGLARAEIPGALHAAEHAAIGLLPLFATCDRSDIGGLSTAWHEQTDRATVFVHDGAPGGAGFAERGYRVAQTWLERTLAVIDSCPCRAGCPACVQSPKCGNGNHPLDKASAVRFLRAVLSHAPLAENNVL
ncbi:DEAD/DEAH box helicase [Rarobacter incanus]|uniref:DEAD/DEAH box helicase domain-containing protein n=1 Tax=Rarobacter incanus TaxID=153494 RepID=A0A542SP64_9MICO|nr:DEAD/DEAH box helicase [Rarobacter incanus]TQK76410.1 DEAD/DEAH box helicase domain-containing protein [Rarobacter incanus]